MKISIDALKASPHLKAEKIGDIISQKYNRHWSSMSKLRIGGGLRIWAKWVIASQNADKIIAPPGRVTRDKNADQQPVLFDFFNDLECEE